MIDLFPCRGLIQLFLQLSQVVVDVFELVKTIEVVFVDDDDDNS